MERNCFISSASRSVFFQDPAALIQKKGTGGVGGKSFGAPIKQRDRKLFSRARMAMEMVDWETFAAWAAFRVLPQRQTSIKYCICKRVIALLSVGRRSECIYYTRKSIWYQ